MSAQSKVLLVLSVLSASALTQNRFVTLQGAVPGAGLGNVGIAMMDASAAGETIPVSVIGTHHAEAGAAVAAGAAVEVDAAGRVITKAAGIGVGRALQAAGALGDVIEVFQHPN